MVIISNETKNGWDHSGSVRSLEFGTCTCTCKCTSFALQNCSKAEEGNCVWCHSYVIVIRIVWKTISDLCP